MGNVQRTAGLLAALFLLAGLAAASAQEPQAAPSARIVVTGEGSATAAPDYAEVTAGVTTRGKTAMEAANANSKAIAAVNAALLGSGIMQKDIQTVQFSVQPVYSQQQPNAEQKLSGFSASNQVRVTLHRIDKMGEILDRLVAAGATDVGNIRFLHSDTAKILDQARQNAMIDAHRKAELYAQAAGLTLGKVAWVSEEPGYAPTLPGAMRGLAAAPVPISPGEDTFRARITVGFAVER